jgi:hypothetical protein
VSTVALYKGKRNPSREIVNFVIFFLLRTMTLFFEMREISSSDKMKMSADILAWRISRILSKHADYIASTQNAAA